MSKKNVAIIMTFGLLSVVVLAGCSKKPPFDQNGQRPSGQRQDFERGDTQQNPAADTTTQPTNQQVTPADAPANAPSTDTTTAAQ